MGPSTLEGDIYHATFSMSILLKRVKAKEQKNVKLKRQLSTLTSFIKSILQINDQSIESAPSIIIEGSNSHKLKEIKRFQSITKAVDKWLEKITVDT